MQNSSNLIIHFSFLHSRFLKQIDNTLSIHGISFTELMVMYHLEKAPEKTMRRINLAESIGLTASGVTRLLNPMEKRKLVEKEINPRDARVSLVKLSKSGETVLKHGMASLQQVTELILQPLNQNQLTEFSQLLNKLG